MARYVNAIRWIADNDDTNWLNDDNGTESVTAALVADLWGKSHARVRADIERELHKSDTTKEHA